MRLNCSAGGSPLPKVTWFKDGRRVVSTAVNDGNDLIKSEFVIHRFQAIDAGMYKCLFFNDKNVTAEANLKLSMYKILNIENTALISLETARSFNNLLVFIRTLSRNVGVSQKSMATFSHPLFHAWRLLHLLPSDSHLFSKLITLVIIDYIVIGLDLV